MSFFDFFSREKDPKVDSCDAREVDAEKFFQQGVQYHKYGNQEEAIKCFTKSLDFSPNHSVVYLNRGACHMIQERYLEAHDDFNHTIDIENKGLSLDAELCGPSAKKNIERISNFIEFEHQSGEAVRNQLTEDGIEYFTKRWAELLFTQFFENDSGATKQFIFEEIKELEEMGGFHQEYALNCGVDHTIFSNVADEYDTYKAFILLKSVLCCFSRDFRKMFKVRIGVLDELMRIVDKH